MMILKTLPIATIVVVLTIDCTAQKLLTGVKAGWQISHLRQRGAPSPIGADAAWRGAFMADYSLTSRLSLYGQVGVQFIPDRTSFFEPHRVVYPEIWIGVTEYLPLGRGAGFVNFSLHSAYATGSIQKPNGSQNLFADPSYKRFRLGYAVMLGHVFHNGLQIDLALQKAFTNFYETPFGGSRYADDFPFGIHAGWLFHYKKRRLVRK